MTIRLLPWFRPILLCLPILIATAGAARAQDTFSIVAVDPVTGQVGSAGASCISGSRIISDVHPGRGAIHTQSYYNSQNQIYARGLMDAGFPPQAIIDSLVANDAQNNPAIRQYGVVDLVDGGRSASFTGNNCLDWKGHRTGPTYAIQGNILLGPQIVDDMEAAFLGAIGSLGDRLMATLQAAKVPGADSRCLDEGKSAISAFVRVARPGDVPGGYHLDLNVNNTPVNVDPIDVLQDLYDDWRLQQTAAPGDVGTQRIGGVLYPACPNPFRSETRIRFAIAAPANARLAVHDPAGRVVAVLAEGLQAPGIQERTWTPDGSVAPGVYLLRLTIGARVHGRTLIVIR
jgi:uncharacterized Ntn-hydrolase superfamily protein